MEIVEFGKQFGLPWLSIRQVEPVGQGVEMLPGGVLGLRDVRVAGGGATYMTAGLRRLRRGWLGELWCTS